METEELQLGLKTLNDPRALAALGMIVAEALKKAGVCSIFINAQDAVEVILPGELECDGVLEIEAIHSLIGKGYTQDMVVAYLKGRDTRFAKRGR